MPDARVILSLVPMSAGTVYLDAVLEPPRSLSPRGFSRVMLALGGTLGWAGRDYFKPTERQELLELNDGPERLQWLQTRLDIQESRDEDPDN